VCGSKDGENSESPAEADSSESEDDLLFLIQAPHGSAIHIPSDQYNQSANNPNNQNQTDQHPQSQSNGEYAKTYKLFIDAPKPPNVQ